MWLSQTLTIPKPNSIEFESNSWSKKRISQIYSPNSLWWVGLASKYNQELIIQIVSILENTMQIQPNFIEFQTLEFPRILIQILAWILKSSNK
jgi:hypothetical protein